MNNRVINTFYNKAVLYFAYFCVAIVLVSGVYLGIYYTMPVLTIQ